MGTFPFGRPILPCRASATDARELFLLGAYPSALHVRWQPPPGAGRLVRALAVDNEPEPFWTGVDQADHLSRWKLDVDWSDAWGKVTPAAELNGPSGTWVEQRVLSPLALNRDSAWITDCLDTYRSSVGMLAAVGSVYTPFAASRDLPAADLVPHPSEQQIVTESVGGHLGRLRRELVAARPSIIVTLGNAALRVLRALLDSPDGPTKLSPGSEYGTSHLVRIAGRPLRWLPLAHPAAPKPYQVAHSSWLALVSAGGRP